MKATIPYVEQKFKEFNQLCFAGKLPELPIELSDAKSFLGKCVYKGRKKKDGTIEYYEFRLRINTRIDLPEDIVEDTIIHEMIHYFIGLNHLEDVSSHGPVFQHLMNSINEKYDRHISISHQYTEEQREQAYDNRPRWHVVAVVKMKDGKVGIKVIPRIVQRILAYRKGVLQGIETETVDFYLSKDPYFNRYPNSTSLKVYFIDPAVLQPYLADAKKLTVTDTHVIVP